ncbi:hypothetical protein [Petrotoga sp. 9PWA.NaAc.5.4]|uniref:hypothetical protein n=1 Tax=Petrotoga sp. 9PWA.NaAc.5.4 TaxID=1434328 RepID=UPI000EFB068A|nr:hypothetical protein [Petrotoga sp. 9PWA.NaAc.5.4]
MNKLLVTILLLVFSVALYSYNIHIFPKNFYIFDDRLDNFLEYYNIEIDENIIILEANTLKEFTKLTNLPYSYYSGAFLNSGDQFVIVTLPFYVLIEKGIFNDTILHEIMHFFLNKNFDYSKKRQEEIISEFLRGKKNEN